MSSAAIRLSKVMFAPTDLGVKGDLSLAQRGGWFNYRLIGDLNKPPRLRRFGGFAKFYLWRSHPSLAKGEFARPVPVGNTPGQGGECAY